MFNIGPCGHEFQFYIAAAFLFSAWKGEIFAGLLLRVACAWTGSTRSASLSQEYRVHVLYEVLHTVADEDLVN